MRSSEGSSKTNFIKSILIANFISKNFGQFVTSSDSAFSCVGIKKEGLLCSPLENSQLWKPFTGAPALNKKGDDKVIFGQFKLFWELQKLFGKIEGAPVYQIVNIAARSWESEKHPEKGRFCKLAVKLWKARQIGFTLNGQSIKDNRLHTMIHNVLVTTMY